ncbi:DNA polymerase III subunit alpha [Bacillus salitolerans]|uniref:DNA polymerase III subunit alpha n=1 Tax=Bacillus salitolerans TaxID=1437434 RepID=A0ABW4LRM4_9BACI
MDFVHLQVKSAYSLLSSTCKIEDLVRRAHELGFTSLAITDENVMYGVIPFYKECVSKGIRPIIGLTVSVFGDDATGITYPLILLAKNKAGYQNLIKISSTVQTKSRNGISKKWVAAYKEGLIAITPGREGEIEQYILQDEMSRSMEVAKYWQDVFGSNFYLSLQDHSLLEERKITKELIHISHQLDIPLVVTNDVHYLQKEDHFVHECLLAIKNGVKLADEETITLSKHEYFLKSKEEMINLFTGYEDALSNSAKIATNCHVEFQFKDRHLPKYPVSETTTSHQFLEELCLSNLKNRGLDRSPYISRLQYELKIIKEMEFSDYFLIVWDFMKYAHDHNILTGPGRGSAAGSLVAYVLSITNVDPIKYNLLFERFLNPERVSMPDIDIDFPDDRRDEVIQYVQKKYGGLHVAQIITFGTLSTKAVLRDVGRVLGIPPKEADAIAKKIPSRLGITLSEAYSESDTFRQHIEQSSITKKLFEVAKKLEGIPRHSSTHAAGIIISEKPLTDMVPIQDGQQGVYLTQYSMDLLEDIGLLKMDFLGLRNLTILDRILERIRIDKRVSLQLEDIPLDDEKTFELLSKGDTTGVFQLESSGMRSVLQRLKPTHFEDIVAVNALYRPGPMENIPVYIKNKRQPDNIQYPHEDLVDILKSTNGVIVYQEQIMQIAAKMAGFSLGKADLLRRAVSKKQKEVLDAERKNFVEGCLKKGYEKQTAHIIYDLIVKFANYGFNRSHAVAYSLIAYQLAYLKANFPLYFMTSLLTSVLGNEEKIAQYIREAKMKELTVLPPSINKSTYPFMVQGNSIRFSLAAIKNVGAQTIKKILYVRKSGPFQDLFDFCVRTGTNRKTMESLLFAGCFDEFGEERSTLLASLDVAIDYAELVKPDKEGQLDFSFEEELLLKPQYVRVSPFKEEEKLRFEMEALGFYLSNHPVSAYKTYWADFMPTLISKVKEEFIGKKCTIVALIGNERTIRTKKGEQMSFLVLSDPGGEIEGTVFPREYREYHHLLTVGNVLLLTGKADLRNGEVQFIIQTVKSMDDLKEKNHNKKLFLKIEQAYENQDTLSQLKQLFKQFHGDTEVVVYYEDSQKTLKLPKELKINPTNECLNKIQDVIGKKNVVLKTF